MKKALIARLHQHFERCARVEDGVEFWLARDLQQLLGYTEWRNFTQVIDRARDRSRATSGGSRRP